MPPPRPNTLTRTPRRCSAWPSSSPITPGPNTATLAGRSSQFEHVVVGHQALAQCLPCGRITRRRAGRDDHARRLDRDALVDQQRGRVDEARATDDAVLSRDGIHAARHESDEAIAFALDPRHDGLAVDPDRTVHCEAERAEAVDRMRGFRRRDQQLARHAADAGAGGAIGARFDQQRALARRLRRAVGGETGRSGADHRHVGDDRLDLHGRSRCHVIPSVQRWGRTSGPICPAHAANPYAAFCRNFSSASAPPIRLPLMNTCGTVPDPAIAPTARDRIVCGSGIST